MTDLALADITRNFIKTKEPCAAGYRWFLRRQEFGSSYQALLDDLVRDGRVDDACWLLDQLGPTSDVLRLSGLDTEALVFAGQVECTGSVDVGTVLRTGRGLTARGGVFAGERLQAGDSLLVAGAVQCGGAIQVGADMRIEWGVDATGTVVCEGNVRTGWGFASGAEARIGGEAMIGQDMHVAGDLVCGQGVKVGGDLHAQGQVQVGRGIHAGGSVRATRHIGAGWGIRAGGDIVSGGAIRAGESLLATGMIEAGAGYGVFAGVDVCMDSWEDSARVTAQCKPERLLSGWWHAP
ncbi:hypothetical protein GCM10007242_41810 [Pigmentiphaga litoralis]|uniref:hypothetical protein n=1 Tax=Pigmentiphaga litoralis TaxID=516702 RepID=UPI001673755C|nr:hypothetical protein [Pigmentiphaga litoralis]GGX30742.1 hypothetical protein GCM10007242_41810 [Pigmentiphaga litoralis]